MLRRTDRRCCAASAVNKSRNRSVDCPLHMRCDSPDARRRVRPNRPNDSGLWRSATLALLRPPHVLSACMSYLLCPICLSGLCRHTSPIRCYHRCLGSAFFSFKWISPLFHYHNLIFGLRQEVRGDMDILGPLDMEPLLEALSKSGPLAFIGGMKQ